MTTIKKKNPKYGSGFITVIIIVLGLFGNSLAQEVTGVVKAKRKKLIKNTVVYLESTSIIIYSSPEEPVDMNQKNMKFVPHVLPILKGTKVNFKNGDAVLHNVFTPDDVADKFNLGSWPQGEVRDFTFEKPGVAVMLCKVHPEMEAWVVVLLTPYFAVADKNGEFCISNVPPGEYTVKVWNKRLKSKEIIVTVPEGDLSLEIEIKR